MRLLFFCPEDLFQAGGGATVAENLLIEFTRTDHTVVLVVRRGTPVPRRVKERVQLRTVRYPRSAALKILADTFLAPVLLSSMECDWVVCLNSVVPLLCWRPLAVFFQMRMFHFRALDDWQKRVKNLLGVLSVLKSRVVFVASNDHRNDLVERLPGLRGKTKVAYLGCSIDGAVVAGQPPDPRYQQPYWLFVSIFRPYKNLDGLLEAYADAKRRVGSLPRLIIVGDFPSGYRGGVAYRRRVLTAVEAAELASDVVFTGVLPHSTVLRLIQHAQLFLHPSKFEGFGLPVLEAMALGVPVIASNVHSIPEIAADTIEYINPHDQRDFANRLEEFARQGYTKSTARALARSKEFSWAATVATMTRELQSFSR